LCHGLLGTTLGIDEYVEVPCIQNVRQFRSNRQSYSLLLISQKLTDDPTDITSWIVNLVLKRINFPLRTIVNRGTTYAYVTRPAGREMHGYKPCARELRKSAIDDVASDQ
jgi:hypothetical protein